MEAINSFVKRLCHMDDRGGRCMIQDMETLVVYDIDHWDERHTGAVQRRFPGCVVSVHTCSSSLSGFIIIIQHLKTQSKLAALMKVALMVITTYIIVHQIRAW